jgi:membrane protein implicated in regulation of membrane protease activity
LRVLLKKDEKTNVDALAGTTAKLLTAISPDNPGSLRINDVVWTAVAKGNTKIESDTEVKIIKVEGNKLVVEPAE